MWTTHTPNIFFGMEPPLLLTLKEIIMDIKDKRWKDSLYRGYLDKEGNLVVEIGRTNARGGLKTRGEQPTVFKKVY